MSSSLRSAGVAAKWATTTATMPTRTRIAGAITNWGKNSSVGGLLQTSSSQTAMLPLPWHSPGAALLGPRAFSTGVIASEESDNALKEEPQEVPEVSTEFSTPEWRPKSEEPGFQSEQHLQRVLDRINLTVQNSGKAFLEAVRSAINCIDPEQRVDGGAAVVHPTSTQALLLIRCMGSLLVDMPPKKRTQLVLHLWSLLEASPNLQLDTSHYNALLKVHVENGHHFSPTEFLAWMEEKGVETNRVTYQNLISKFCNEGDIAGATAILEHMKSKDMMVNESVFHALITGHCIAGNFEAAEEMLKLMSEARLMVSGETHLCLLYGMAKGGKPWEEVKAALEKVQSGEDGVQFQDYDYLKLAVEYAARGEVDSAKEIMELLPKKAGFIHEIRNVVPAFIHMGQPDLAFEVAQMMKVTNAAASGKFSSFEHGSFFMTCLVKSDADVDTVVKFAKKFLEIRKDHPAIARALEECVRLEKIDYGKELFKAFTAEFGKRAIVFSHFDTFVNKVCGNAQTAKELVRVTGTLTSVGIRPSGRVVAEKMVGKILEFYPEKHPGWALSLLIKQGLQPSVVFNGAVAYNLTHCSENPEKMKKAVQLCSKFPGFTRLVTFDRALVRAYLETLDDQAFLDIYFCSMHDRVVEERFEDAVKALGALIPEIYNRAPMVRPQDTREDIIKNLLQKMVKAQLGIPKEAADSLSAMLMPETGEEIKALLDEAVKLFDDIENVWPKEKAAERRQQIHDHYNKRNSMADYNIENLPKDTEGLKEVHDSLGKQGKLSYQVIVKLMTAYEKENNFVEIAKLMIAAEDKFVMPGYFCRRVVKGLLPDDAVWAAKMLKVAYKVPGNKISVLSAMEVISSLVEQDNVKMAIEFAESIDKETSYYVDFRTPMQWTNVLRGVSSESDRAVLEGHLRRLDINAKFDAQREENLLPIEEAVEEFIKNVAEKRRLTGKFSLMERLIQMEDMENMQRVLDASIKLIGEERSLYELSESFLKLDKFAQAQRLLATPGLRYDQKAVEKITNHVTADRLEKFVAFMRPVFACDREFLYNKLVDKVGGDKARLEEVQLSMQEEGFVPSERLQAKIEEKLKASTSDEKATSS